MSQVNSSKTVRSYPWEKWFNPKKNKFVVVRNVDFFCMTHSMVAQIRTAAAKRGVNVSIAVNEDTITANIWK